MSSLTRIICSFRKDASCFRASTSRSTLGMFWRAWRLVSAAKIQERHCAPEVETGAGRVGNYMCGDIKETFPVTLPISFEHLQEMRGKTGIREVTSARTMSPAEWNRVLQKQPLSTWSKANRKNEGHWCGSVGLQDYCEKRCQLRLHREFQVCLDYNSETLSQRNKKWGMMAPRLRTITALLEDGLWMWPLPLAHGISGHLHMRTHAHKKK